MAIMNDYAEILAKDDCLLLLVDLQKTLLDACFEKDPVTRNAAALIDLAGVFEIPILASVHNPEKLGGFLPELLERIPQPSFYSKLEFSCFENEKIFRALQETGCRTVLLAGLETHVCIFQTAAHALRLGYRVHVVADAVTSRRKVDKEVGLGRLERAGAVISSTEMVIFEMVNRAGTPEFRAVLPLLKKL
jgi:nicotinamidase-related amidase